MRPKSLSAENLSAAAPPDYFDAPAGSRAPSGRGLPLLHSMLPSKSFYLSLPVVKEHPRRVARRGEIPGWWAHLDSNQGPLPYQRSALTN